MHSNDMSVPRSMRKYFKFLSPTDKWLYSCLCDLCPADNTKPFSLRKLEIETGIPKSTLGRIVPKLTYIGVIRTEKKPFDAEYGGPDIWHIAPIRFTEEEAKQLSDLYESPLKSMHLDLSQEVNRIEQHIENAREYGLQATLTIHEWLQTLQHYESKCAYCQGRYELIEHYIPITLGGGTTAYNCVPACRGCNKKKNSYHPLLVPVSTGLSEAIKQVGEYLQGLAAA